mmetsp:Transcript_28834/g.91916  ORF Transcript_28834/g.91916 Transcript_28834/m.91916 type:complete len:158 (-) Transcript_28834:222-695(-)
MPSTLFAAKQVTYGSAPFRNVRIGYNAASGCLNLLVPGARCGAIEVAKGLKGKDAPEVRAEGSTCFVGKSSYLAVTFETEEQVRAFEACIKGGTATPAAKPVAASPATPPVAAGEPAPSTPPTRNGAAHLAMATDITPQRVKRARVQEELAEECCKK